VTNAFVAIRGDDGGVTVQTASEGILLGSMRQLCLDACAQLGYSVVEVAPRLHRAHTWTEAFLTGQWCVAAAAALARIRWRARVSPSSQFAHVLALVCKGNRSRSQLSDLTPMYWNVQQVVFWSMHCWHCLRCAQRLAALISAGTGAALRPIGTLHFPQTGAGDDALFRAALQEHAATAGVRAAVVSGGAGGGEYAATFNFGSSDIGAAVAAQMALMLDADAVPIEELWFAMTLSHVNSVHIIQQAYHKQLAIMVVLMAAICANVCVCMQIFTEHGVQGRNTYRERPWPSEVQPVIFCRQITHTHTAIHSALVHALFDVVVMRQLQRQSTMQFSPS
jgi:hypothetical protein